MFELVFFGPSFFLRYLPSVLVTFLSTIAILLSNLVSAYISYVSFLLFMTVIYGHMMGSSMTFWCTSFEIFNPSFLLICFHSRSEFLLLLTCAPNSSGPCMDMSLSMASKKYLYPSFYICFAFSTLSTFSSHSVISILLSPNLCGPSVPSLHLCTFTGTGGILAPAPSVLLTLIPWFSFLVICGLLMNPFLYYWVHKCYDITDVIICEIPSRGVLEPKYYPI